MKKCILLLFIIVNLNAENMDFNFLVINLLKNNKNINTKNIDLEISKKDIEILNSSLYPSISVSSTLEKSKSFKYNNSSINNNNISSNTSVKNYNSINFDYTLYDFGKHDTKENYQNLEVNQKNMEICSEKKQLVLKLLELYSNIIQLKENYFYYQNILKINNEKLKMKTTLYNNDQIKILELKDEEYNSKNINYEINKLKLSFLEKSKEIYELTGVNLSFNNNFINFKYINKVYVADIENIDINILNNEIKKKQEELKIINKEYYPDIKFYSKYDFYGDNENNAREAIENVEKNSFKAGMYFNMTLFNGNSTSLNKEKALFELKKIKNELTYKENNLKNEIVNIDLIIKEKNILINYLTQLNDLLMNTYHYSESLYKNGFETKINILENQLKYLNKNNELNISNIELNYLSLKRELLINGENEICNRY